MVLERGVCRGEALLFWQQDICAKVDSQIQAEDFLIAWKDANVCCAIIYHFRSDLISYPELKTLEPRPRIKAVSAALEKVIVAGTSIF